MKEYVKPELYYESFELSQHIAGCNLTMVNNIDPVTCTASGTIGDETWGSWFVEANASCTVKTESYCYNNASFNVTTINS